jgi:hypothetical protein
LRPGYINKKKKKKDFLILLKYKILRIYLLVPESEIPYFLACAIFINARVGNIHRQIFTDARIGNITG